MAERILAHTCSFAEIMRHCFAGIGDAAFRYRLRLAIEREAQLRSCFLSAGHRKRFRAGMSLIRKTEYSLIAQLYLLSAHEALWQETRKVLEADGVVGELTWDAIYNAYLGIVEGIPIRYTEGNVIPYPGFLLRLGAESEIVRVLQEYLNYVSISFPEIPGVNPTGYFGNRTQEAVIAFQTLIGLPANGVVGALTWNALTDLYSDLYNGSRVNEGQYPGYELGAT